MLMRPRGPGRLADLMTFSWIACKLLIVGRLNLDLIKHGKIEVWNACNCTLIHRRTALLH